MLIITSLCLNFKFSFKILYVEQAHGILILVTKVSSEGSDETAQIGSLARAFCYWHTQIMNVDVGAHKNLYLYQKAAHEHLNSDYAYVISTKHTMLRKLGIWTISRPPDTK